MATAKTSMNDLTEVIFQSSDMMMALGVILLVADDRSNPQRSR